MIFDYKYRPQPSIPDFPNINKNNTPSMPSILDEIFAPLMAELPTNYNNQPTMYKGQKSPDGSIYTLAIEIPRLVRDTITVEIEEDLKSTSQFRRVGYTSYKIVIKAAQRLLINYLDATEESAKKKYEEECALEGQVVDLAGTLGLSYSEGVLCIEIPLCKPTAPKKVALQASLKDIDSNG